MATKKRGGGGGKRRRWTIRQREAVTNVFGGEAATQRDLDRIDRLLKLMREHKVAERQRKRSRRKRRWPTKR